MAGIRAFFARMWEERRGATVGIIIGVSVAAVILIFGFWQSVFLMLSGLIGFAIGARIDSKENFQKMMNRIFGDSEMMN